MVATSGSTVNNFLTDDAGAVLAFSSTVSGITTSYVPIQDGMGSTVALVDQNGNLTNTYTYDPAGSVTKTGTVSFPYQYGGAEFDSQTGLYHVGSYYDPVLERLVSGATPTGAAGPSLAGGAGPVGAGGPGFSQSAAIAGGIGVAAAESAAFAYASAAATDAGTDAVATAIGVAINPFVGAALGIAEGIGAAFGFGQLFGGSSPFIPV